MDLEQQMRKDHDELKTIRERQDYLEKRLNIQSNLNREWIELSAEVKEIKASLEEIKTNITVLARLLNTDL